MSNELIEEFDRVSAISSYSGEPSDEAVSKAKALVRKLAACEYAKGDEHHIDMARMLRMHGAIIANTLAKKYETELRGDA